ncbi:hypothetical protein HJFPF1_03570 [Paramyrothecium foliicola]|nr:hypothetical protein HJFPF1_03570 [Paramyrothecium foliicola]
MATKEEVVQRLLESRPPASDNFTYLTIVEKSLSPEILPTLQEILEDVELTKEIGWDLVEMLIPVSGSADCLVTIARLGNPREVILKVLEVMEKTAASEEPAEANKRFITLVGMLGILHKRLQVRAPSRFLHTTLDTVYRVYDASSAEATAAVIQLVRSLSGRTRPPLPTRQSSTKLDTPFTDSDHSRSAPDPEAEKGGEEPGRNANEPHLIERLLQSFITCVIEAYVNTNNLEWAARLLEFTLPERLVPGRRTMVQVFKDTPELQAKDELVGQLVAVARDLGLSGTSSAIIKEVLAEPLCTEPLSDEIDDDNQKGIGLSTGGFVCLMAYWMFSSDVYDAHHECPDISMFPEHHLLLERFLEEEPQGQIMGNPGTVEALVVMSIWLDAHSRVLKEGGTVQGGEEAEVPYMSYLHQLTLVSVFHPNIRVRNAATVMAGIVLHADPEESDRLAILEDLLENCIFSSLQACAVTWLREEIISARELGHQGRFSSPDCFDALQYTLFPDLSHLRTADASTILDFWTQSSPFHLQVANFALFLFSSNDHKATVPSGMAAAVEHRYVEPLLHAAKVLTEAAGKNEVDGAEPGSDVVGQLSILTDTLNRVPLQ